MSKVTKVINWIIFMVVGLILGATLAINVIADWIELSMDPRAEASSLISNSRINTDVTIVERQHPAAVKTLCEPPRELVWRLDAKCNKLAVVRNYGAQKTANVHVLEPKASDAYLQYAPVD